MRLAYGTWRATAACGFRGVWSHLSSGIPKFETILLSIRKPFLKSHTNGCSFLSPARLNIRPGFAAGIAFLHQWILLQIQDRDLVTTSAAETELTSEHAIQCTLETNRTQRLLGFQYPSVLDRLKYRIRRMNLRFCGISNFEFGQNFGEGLTEIALECVIEFAEQRLLHQQRVSLSHEISPPFEPTARISL
jgi:hypothetical protein